MAITLDLQGFENVLDAINENNVKITPESTQEEIWTAIQPELIQAIQSYLSIDTELAKVILTDTLDTLCNIKNLSEDAIVLHMEICECSKEAAQLDLIIGTDMDDTDMEDFPYGMQSMVAMDDRH